MTGSWSVTPPRTVRPLRCIVEPVAGIRGYPRGHAAATLDILLRRTDKLPASLAAVLIANLGQIEDDLTAGALVVIGVSAGEDS